MIPYNVLTATRYGTFLVNRQDEYVGGSLLTYGEFSELEVAFLAPYLAPGSVVLDLGANVGALTVPFARRVGPRGTVIAFEPQRLVYQTLCANLALNSLTNVQALPYAVGNPGPEEGSIRIPLTDPYQPNNFGGVRCSADANGETAPLMSLDELGLPACALLKADVEGMEAEVLQGGMAYLAAHRPVLYLEADRTASRNAMVPLLAALGYDAWRHSPPLYNPDNFRGDPVNRWPGIVSENWLCLPRDRGHAAPDLARAT